MGEVQNACSNFFHQHKTVPDTVKMAYHDYQSFISQMPYKIEVLDKSKDYGLFIAIPGGMVELQLLDLSDEINMTTSGGSIIVVESTRIDREFEKHVLKGE